MDAISLFSGAGGFEIGLERAGIRTVLQAESDPWCLSVLERHWPDVERVTDVRQVDASTLRRRCRDLVGVGNGADADAERLGAEDRRRSDTTSAVDLVYGGFPCQDLSVAGARAGLGGERSSLWFEFRRVLSELRPRWCLIENVPGLLSSDGGGDMATILGGLGDLGYGWAYRVLDARWFGVPQRRRRVFIVGCLGDASRAAAVLAVCESCGGHPAARREAGEDIAPTLDDGARRASVELPMIPVARPLTARESGYRMDYETENFLVARALTSPSPGKGGSYRLDDHENLVAPCVDGVRRLTPLECERVQGWPDGHTEFAADGNRIPDSHRYRMIGNGVASPCAEWIGHRLVWVDQHMEEDAA